MILTIPIIPGTYLSLISCDATNADGRLCTLKRGHRGKHEAYVKISDPGLTGFMIYEWENGAGK